MPTVHVNSVCLYYETHGSGPTLVLIAGLNSDHTLFRAFIPQLAERYRVLVLDNRGIGQSTGAASAFTIETLADDTAALLHALGIRRAHVLGVSLGGRIAAALALQHADLVHSLILVSTCLEPPPRPWHQRLVGLVLRLPLVRRGNAYSVVARQRAAIRIFNVTDRLHEFHVPTLILVGRKDRLAPSAMVQQMHEQIAGSRVITFGGGHLFFLVRARPFLDAVLAFLTAVDDGRTWGEQSRAHALADHAAQESGLVNGALVSVGAGATIMTLTADDCVARGDVRHTAPTPVHLSPAAVRCCPPDR